MSGNTEPLPSPEAGGEYSDDAMSVVTEMWLFLGTEERESLRQTSPDFLSVKGGSVSL